MTLQLLFFIYGLCVMFYFMMAWLFFRRSSELLSRLVGTLMLVVGGQYTKDLFFLVPGSDSYRDLWMMVTSTDMVAVPLYAFILIELCRPGSLTLRSMLLHELPFVVLSLLFISTGNVVFYYFNVGWAGVYGLYYAVWTMISIPRYHRLLTQRFSYQENINLNWLRIILVSFFVILSLWLLDCFVINFNIESIYMTGSLMIWMFICYFIYKHESVMDELVEVTIPAEVEEAGEDVCECDDDSLRARIQRLFEVERIYLNPQLKLSDVARLAGSNRTYVSRVFNGSHGKTFFEYVNEYRVNYAMMLLQTTSERIEIIAERSGFNSRQSFHRVFVKVVGCTPEKYRAQK